MAAPSTTEAVQVKEISDGVIVLKNDTLRAVVEINAINFELRSGDEQAAIIQQFQGFLNSVDFPFQIVVHSRKFDITGYVATIQEASAALTNELLKVQSQEYIRFVSELSDLANIMMKKFYVILPFAAAPSTTLKGGLFSGITGLFKKKPAQQVGIPTEQLASAKIQLQQRADLIIGGLSGMGLTGKILGQEDVLQLMGDLYNPVVPAAHQETPAAVT